LQSLAFASPPARLPGELLMGLDMAKEDTLTFEGVVREMLPDSNILVEVAKGHKVIAQASGQFRKRFVRLERGVRVRVEVSLHDLTRGRLV
jgi:translation initiation factor IF-1